MLAEALAKQKLVAVLVMASPADAQISISTFAPDDTFVARTIHLPPGKYTFTATAPGYANRTEEVEIGDQAGGAVSFNLERRIGDKPKVVEPSKVPWVVVGGGVALVVAGALVHTLGLAPARDMLVNADATGDQGLYMRYSATFDRDRALAIGLYGAGALAIATGFVLRATVFKAPEAQVAITPTTGGGMLTLSWSR